MARQPKLVSLVEASVGTLFGFVFSFTIQKVLNWAYDVQMTDATAWAFVFWFTLASIVRGYIVRRMFENQIWKVHTLEALRSLVRRETHSEEA